MPDTFTPEQISQILEEFFRVVGTRQYIGARYVPIFGRKGEETIEWDNTAPYEPLTIVLYQGNSYTSRQFVPVGVEITNQEFWAITGNYNAQVEQYRRETAAAREVADNALTAANNAQTDINTLLPKTDFSAENTVKKYVDDSVAKVQDDIDTLLPKVDFSAENTVKKYIDDSIENTVDTMLERLSGKLSIVDSYADLAATTNDYVFVVHNDSPYGDGGGCFFGVTTYTNGTIQRNDGTYVTAIPNQTDIISSEVPMYDILKVAETYINNDALVYGNAHTLFNASVNNEIDCSAFVQACLEGISYNKSRYARGTLSDNVSGKYLGQYIPHNIPNTNGKVPTWLMARWFLEHKSFYKFTGNPITDIASLRAGDVLFSSSATFTDENRLYDIDHCMLVIQVNQSDGTVLIAQCGSAISTIANAQYTVGKLTLIDFIHYLDRPDGKNYIGFGRPSYGSGRTNGNNIATHFYSYGNVSVLEEAQDVNLARIKFAKPLQPNTIYTLYCKGKLPKYDYDGCWLVGTINGVNVARMYRISNYADEAIFTFSTNDAVTGANADTLYIRAILTDKTEYASSFNISGAAIYDGYSAGGELLQTLDITDIESEYVSNKSLSLNTNANKSIVIDGYINLVANAPIADIDVAKITGIAFSNIHRFIVPKAATEFAVLTINTDGTIRLTNPTQRGSATVVNISVKIDSNYI